ncbi:MAG TPA: M28 family peptidase [Bacteroidota bacterium]|nr:M28 family peptidase [Bacteroidota bacterium]
MRLTIRNVLLVLVMAGCAPPANEFTSPEITSQELREHVRYLASDELKGRRAGEEGNRQAAGYIAARFKQYALTAPFQPRPGSSAYLQEFTFVSSRRPGKKNSLRLTANSVSKDFTPERQYRTLSFSADTSLTAPLMFAGYGISAHDSVQFDDYAGSNVRGKVVVVLRYSPSGPGENSFTRYMSISEKTFAARDSGAAGIIFLTAPAGSEGAELSSFPQAAPLSVSAIPCVALRWEEMQLILAGRGKDLAAIQKHLDSAKTPASFALPGVTVSLQTQIEKVIATTANIVGYLPGSDPALKDEAVLVGAHMDHLGMGGEGSGSLSPGTSAIHHGADDNASGSAGLLELAQYFAAHRGELKRTIILAAFSGEELGLLGSAYYVKNPLFPLDKTIAMLNMDMVGRLRDSVLVVEGMGTSPRWDSIVRRENRDSLALKLKPDGFGPSDHASFYAKDIPVIFFFTNMHSDYHRPSDTWDKINYAGEQKVVELVQRVTESIANAPSRPQFTRAASGSMAGSGDRQGLRVSLGVIPDYSEDVQGLKITGTRPGSPAEKAGMKAEDIVIKFDGMDVKNIYDFMRGLEGHKPGDKVAIVVKRGIEVLSFNAVLEARR